MRTGQAAERFQDYDRAVVEYTKAVRAKPDDRSARLALERARLRASQNHYFRGQRLAAAERHEEALVEYQLAGELNPTDANVESAVRTERQKLRARAAVSRGGKTELQALDRTVTHAEPGRAWTCRPASPSPTRSCSATPAAGSSSPRSPALPT